MAGMGGDIFGGLDPTTPIGRPPSNEPAHEPSQEEAADVVRRINTIKADKQHFEKVFLQMRADMFVATYGRVPEWAPDNYTANITGRHVKQRAAALYAKNPKVSAKRRESMDFAVWDENPASLQLAQQTIQMAQMSMAPDPETGVMVPSDPLIAQGFQQAMAVMEDFQQGLQWRQTIAKVGRTLEILYSNQMRQQQPVDFKTGMKRLVRRTCVSSVGYVELGFKREMGVQPEIANAIVDATERLAHMQQLAEGLADGQFDETSSERAELEASLAAYQATPEVVMSEGLIVDYPASTSVIPDKATKSLTGFVGANHMTVEYIWTVEKVKETFGVELSGAQYTPYRKDSLKAKDDSANTVPYDDDFVMAAPGKGGFVCVWKHYDRPSGLVYWLADGYRCYLKPPAAPDVFVETFWPLYALTFNDVENEDILFPPSDVQLMLHQQKEVNRSRQGKREHREAARPRWVASKGAFGSEEDPKVIASLKPFEVGFLSIDPQTEIGKVLQPIPVEGVDPNLYDTNEVMMDLQFGVGAQEAQFGGTSKSTATESAIAAHSTKSTDDAAIDDLDAFLTVIARNGGQILLGNMSEEQVKRIVGRGAVWPHASLSEIADEIWLEVAAGSTGKPNQAVEVQNWQILAPILQATPGVSPDWMAKETARRLDDNVDFTEALASGVPSIVAQNALASKPPAAPGGGAASSQGGDAAEDPAAQGPAGAGNAPAPPGGPGGSGPAFGSNQVEQAL